MHFIMYKVLTNTKAFLPLYKRACTQCMLSLRGFSQNVILMNSKSGRNEDNKRQDSSSSSLDVSREKPYSQLTATEKVVEAGKTASYTGIVLVGFGITAMMFYYIGRELFAKDSSVVIFSQALKLCKKDTRVIDTLGEPLKGYGETTRRGRRRHVSHGEFMLDGVKHMRMIFYIEGPLRKGTVHVEKKEDEKGNYEFIYLIVELEGFPHKIIRIIDNR